MNDSTDHTSPSPDVARAEEMVDAAGRAVSAVAAQLWGRVAQNFGLAREEAEDIVAEARNASRNDGV